MLFIIACLSKISLLLKVVTPPLSVLLMLKKPWASETWPPAAQQPAPIMSIGGDTQKVNTHTMCPWLLRQMPLKTPHPVPHLLSLQLLVFLGVWVTQMLFLGITVTL